MIDGLIPRFPLVKSPVVNRPASLTPAVSSLATQAAEMQVVAVAAYFTAPMQKIAAEFAKDTGHQVLLEYLEGAKATAIITSYGHAR